MRDSCSFMMEISSDAWNDLVYAEVIGNTWSLYIWEYGLKQEKIISHVIKAI